MSMMMMMNKPELVEREGDDGHSIQSDFSVARSFAVHFFLPFQHYTNEWGEKWMEWNRAVVLLFTF
jgi:hypothetical protein